MSKLDEVERQAMDFCVEFAKREGIDAWSEEWEPLEIEDSPTRMVILRAHLDRLRYQKVLPVSNLAHYNGELGSMLAYEIGRMRAGLRQAALRGGG